VGTVLGKWRLSGFVAWAGWLFIHLLYLVGFRNRFWVFADWAYSYLTVRRGARLITAESRSEVDRPLVLLPENVTASAGGDGAVRAPDQAHAPH
jgi:NADH dehydrogenase